MPIHFVFVLAIRMVSCLNLNIFQLKTEGVRMGEVEDGYHTGDDFNLEKESEFILEYLENFNELFDNGKYIQAAYYAAASPKNILRNIETLYKFKRKNIILLLNTLAGF